MEKTEQTPKPQQPLIMDKIISHTRRPDITFHRTGRIDISARVAIALGLAPGDTINIALYSGEYLLFSTRHPPGTRNLATCRPTKRGSLNFRAHSTTLTSAILAACGHPPKAAFHIGYPMTIDNQTYLPIITKHPIL